MGRRPCSSKNEGMLVKKGAWTVTEDNILKDYINSHGEGNWGNVPKATGLKRCGKSCRLRWLNYLNPNIKRGNIAPDEEDLIIRLHKLLGNRWSLIAGRLPGRTDNEIKNYWNTTLSKKLLKQSNNEERQAPKEPYDIIRVSANETHAPERQEKQEHDQMVITNNLNDNFVVQSQISIVDELAPILVPRKNNEEDSSSNLLMMNFGVTGHFSNMTSNLDFYKLSEPGVYLLNSNSRDSDQEQYTPSNNVVSRNIFCLCGTILMDKARCCWCA